MSTSARSGPRRLAARNSAAGGIVGAAITLACLGTFGSPSAAGVQWGADVAAGVLETDNIFRTETNKKSALVRVAETEFAASESTRKLDLDAIGSVVYRQYGLAGVSDDTLPSFDGIARWSAVPDRFSWMLSDNLGQFAVNANDSLLQQDRETLNVVNTGPDLRLPLGTNSGVNFGARYSHVTYQRLPFDNDRVAGDLAFEHELESGTTWNLKIFDAHTRYTDVDTSFDVRTASAGYTAVGRRGQIDANIGYTQLHELGENHSGFFADIRFERQVSRRAAVALDVVDRYADSSQIFSRQQDLEPVIQTVSFVPSDTAARELAGDLSVNFTGRRSDAMLGVRYYQTDFVHSGGADNRTGVGGYFSGTFRISPTLALLGRSEIRQEEPGVGRSSTYLQVGGDVAWNFTRKLNLLFGAARFQQTGAGVHYREMRYSAALQWTISKIPGIAGRPEIGTPAVRRISISR